MKFNRWLVVVLALIVALLSVACGGEGIPLSSAPAPLAHVAPEAPALLQFTAGEHVLGFTPNAAYAANGSHAYRVEFVDARPTTPLADAAPGTETGTAAQAAPLTQVTYSQLWPGITLTYDAPDGALLRSTYRVEPNADPTHIRLRYNAPVQIKADGTLALTYRTGKMHESAPVAWQERADGVRTSVAVAFQTFADQDHQGETVGFRLGAYDSALPLFIDPTLTWNTFLGGSSWDEGYGIAVDGSGSVYVVGYSDGTWGTPVRPLAGSYDVFVAKLDSGGSLVWNTFLGGSGSDEGTAIAVDEGGSVYVTGNSYGDTWGTPIRPYTAMSDGFVARLNSSSGALIWNTFLGGPNGDYGNGLALDGNGNVYVTGYSNSTWGSPTHPYTASSDAYVARLNSSGTLIWHTFLGGVEGDSGKGIAVDESGNVYVVGYSYASWGSPVLPYTANADGFVARLDGSHGGLTWHTFLGGTGDDSGRGLALDGNGNIYVTGDSEATWGSPVHPYTGDEDAFVARLNSSNGLLTWNTFLGGTGGDYGNGIAVDGNGDVYVSGDSDATWGSPDRPYTAAYDAFAAQLNSSGTLISNTFLGGTDGDFGNGLAVDGSGNVYVVGDSYASWGSPVRPYTAETDAFVAQLSFYQKVYLPIIIK
jgi:hypothetical protein